MRVAAAQARPFWLDPSATTKKVIAWLENAAAQQVELIAFPETFLSGYPSWLEHTGGARFDDAMQKRAYAAYLDAAVEVTGPELALSPKYARNASPWTRPGITADPTSSP
jgi:nitrilase